MKLLTLFDKPADPTYDFYPYCGDTEELFKKNLSNKPADWIWRTEPIKYEVNTQGYRCSEWNQIDWSNSVLMLGCSYVFGTGIDARHTAANHLSKALDIPVINLGIPGASPMFQWINTTLLIEEQVKPRTVIYIWPHHSRTTEFVNKGDPVLVRNCGSWLPGFFGKLWLTNQTQSLEFLRSCVVSTSNVWRCPVLHYTLDEENNQAVPNVKMLHEIDGDEARDSGGRISHPGIKTNESWAKILIDELRGLDKK